MHSPGINGEGELRGQPTNPGSPGKMAVKTEVYSLYLHTRVVTLSLTSFFVLIPFSADFWINTVCRSPSDCPDTVRVCLPD